MTAKPPRPARLVLAAAAALALLSGCGSMSMGERLGSVITPYKVEVVQGNFISKEQVEALQKGMTREQVRQVLGTPLVTSLFHGERWDYVFTLKRRGLEPQQRRLTVFFSGDVLERTEGDSMPSEAEFVATLDRREHGKVPRLEATEEELRAFASKQQPAAPVVQPAPAAVPAAPASYPPLEPPAR